MAYRETKRMCARCGHVTLHWRPRLDVRPAGSGEGDHFSLPALVRAVRRSLVTRWRCVECDHPWQKSLLRGPIGSERPRGSASS